ncbi:hypothetical protein [Marinomonas mediterranea]|jgi:hypothetical protein|uniref:Uncharacterized protein n=1 Tax=Marinomonas mediterranea (strain ATCC 700492 / JCM 21426 / NBRC 103028 / MMB-1) TaxID=717774 RepID=F2K420_MARM1|nr:hypothetical protein [Marinomonas mediterranea]ADZ91362.1 hypothetical protein Marme_2118 [Marinomonas mediterranea MMB-1]WCN09335.1 hypothetical protein GV055_10550 [Marinomonas mediterranea]WCN13412.1 hypothetical protein GV054_10540 [Marinomonas mediterranea]WCN17480.1 hypothetical protein GV053_10665 [Marinomonas mediterranea MMB-1]
MTTLFKIELPLPNIKEKEMDIVDTKLSKSILKLKKFETIGKSEQINLLNELIYQFKDCDFVYVESPTNKNKIFDSYFNINRILSNNRASIITSYLKVFKNALNNIYHQKDQIPSHELEKILLILPLVTEKVLNIPYSYKEELEISI